MIFGEDVAAHYEAWYETPEGRRVDELEKAILDYLLQAFAQPGSVLEIGCGTAHFTRWLSDQGLAAVGVDLSAAMLAQARALDSVPLMRGDAYKLPFSDGAFDLAVLLTTLEFLERPQEALAEALRVARCWACSTAGARSGSSGGWRVSFGRRSMTPHASTAWAN